MMRGNIKVAQVNRIREKSSVRITLLLLTLSTVWLAPLKAYAEFNDPIGDLLENIAPNGEQPDDSLFINSKEQRDQYDPDKLPQPQLEKQGDSLILRWSGLRAYLHPEASTVNENDMGWGGHQPEQQNPQQLAEDSTVRLVHNAGEKILHRRLIDTVEQDAEILRGLLNKQLKKLDQPVVVQSQRNNIGFFLLATPVLTLDVEWKIPLRGIEDVLKKQRFVAEKKRKEEKKRLVAERKRKVAERKRKAAEARLAAERKRKVEQERLVVERKRKAEEQRLAAERKRKAEEERLAAERKRKAEEKRLAAERKRQKEVELVKKRCREALPVRDWNRAWQLCPGSVVAGHNVVVTRLEEGDSVSALEALQELKKRFPAHPRVKKLQDMLLSPFKLAGERAQRKLQQWVMRPSEVPPFTERPPQKPEAPPLPTLVKDEFETTAMFQNRVEQARKQREELIREIEEDYIAEVDSFNAAVKRHNEIVKQEQADRASNQKRAQMRRQFLAETISEVLGDPKLGELKYDADSATFFTRLYTRNGLFDERVTVSVPLDQARDFKRGASAVEPRIYFSEDNGVLKLARIEAHLENNHYSVAQTQESFVPVTLKQQVAAVDLMIDELPMLETEALDTSALVADSDNYFKEALQLQKDPQLAKLQQQEAENRRKLRDAQQRRAREERRKRMEEVVREQQRQLAVLGGPEAEELKGLEPKRSWRFQRAASDQKVAEESYAVVIGNRNYRNGVPMLHYARNDAKAMRQFFHEAMGLPEENILYQEDATMGDMVGIFESSLPKRVQADKSKVYVYFSGHGMPTGKDARLLPVDSRPETAEVTGYSRKRMLQQLAMLSASETTVMLDACFTGISGGRSLTPGAKAIYRRAPDAGVPKNMVLISASGADESSWQDDEAGLSLMTLHFLEGVTGKADQDGDRAIHTSELQSYLQGEVNRAAVILHESSQHPQVRGSARSLLRYE